MKPHRLTTKQPQTRHPNLKFRFQSVTQIQPNQSDSSTLSHLFSNFSVKPNQTNLNKFVQHHMVFTSSINITAQNPLDQPQTGSKSAIRTQKSDFRHSSQSEIQKSDSLTLDHLFLLVVYSSRAVILNNSCSLILILQVSYSGH